MKPTLTSQWKRLWKRWSNETDSEVFKQWTGEWRPVSPSLSKEPGQQRVKRWGFGFNEVLKDPVGREQFLKFLESEFSSENLRYDRERCGKVLSTFWTNVLPFALTERSFKVIWCLIMWAPNIHTSSMERCFLKHLSLSNIFLRTLKSNVHIMLRETV